MQVIIRQSHQPMKSRLTRSRVVVGDAVSLTLIIGTLLLQRADAAGAEEHRNPQSAPNRTVPKIDPPKTIFDLPAAPTTQDIFRIRAFEEPLAPVGGEPTAAE